MKCRLLMKRSTPLPLPPREREKLQVQSYLVEQLDAETEMEPIETKNIRLQTMNTVVIEMSVQSEDLGVTNSFASYHRYSKYKSG